MTAGRRVVVAAPLGLHARPAADIAKRVRDSSSRLTIVSEDGRRADAASVIALMTLDVRRGDTVRLEPPDDPLLDAVERILTGG
ncbi:HPr family phosphocarrier protein [Microbacterium betulae]|uniref:Phosphocarrier protein HPr n=1 Tax=Microbacterium betulae TaxID=2981139 RepID=A0AA97FJE0_9MICO|nr:HPr family phosphocarrier protein [Microbacterium sp. AB]WOF24145.1 HPr family phosphocarrier protein [Microbacterium sp. AB]